MAAPSQPAPWAGAMNSVTTAATGAAGRCASLPLHLQPYNLTAAAAAVGTRTAAAVSVALPSTKKPALLTNAAAALWEASTILCVLRMKEDSIVGPWGWCSWPPTLGGHSSGSGRVLVAGSRDCSQACGATWYLGRRGRLAVAWPTDGTGGAEVRRRRGQHPLRRWRQVGASQSVRGDH